MTDKLGKEVRRVCTPNLEGELAKGGSREIAKDLDGSRSYHLIIVGGRVCIAHLILVQDYALFAHSTPQTPLILSFCFDYLCSALHLPFASLNWSIHSVIKLTSKAWTSLILEGSLE
jgi:hypothetical protein